MSPRTFSPNPDSAGIQSFPCLCLITYSHTQNAMPSRIPYRVGMPLAVNEMMCMAHFLATPITPNCPEVIQSNRSIFPDLPSAQTEPSAVVCVSFGEFCQLCTMPFRSTLGHNGAKLLTANFGQGPGLSNPDEINDDTLTTTFACAVPNPSLRPPLHRMCIPMPALPASNTCTFPSISAK